MSYASIMIAAFRGRSGKTVITLGMLRALTRRGVVVQPFKKGPDFIDPGWHRIACKRASRNLDSFFMTPEQICRVMFDASEGSDLSFIEGAMGLFDGMDIEGSSSSAEIARITNTPIILVVDTTRMTRTTAALVLGCQQFDPDIYLAGVILNRVRSQRHELLVRQAIESYCGIPVLGALPVDNALEIPDRHLGLISSEEVLAGEDILDRIADFVESHVDLDAVIALAQKANILCRPANLAEPDSQDSRDAIKSWGGTQGSTKPRIAIIRDPAFCFYYEENLQALQNQGAELVFANSLKATTLPENINALYIGGGFSEVFTAELEANESFRSSVKEAIEAALPVYAECGGMTFLGRTLEYQGRSYKMVGALPFDTVLQDERQAHGYSILEAKQNKDFAVPTTLTGHEFHYSKVVNLDPNLSLAFKVNRGHGIDGKQDGICYKGVLAVCTHVNALASPHWAEKLVEQARAHQIRLIKEPRK